MAIEWQTKLGFFGFYIATLSLSLSSTRAAPTAPTWTHAVAFAVVVEGEVAHLRSFVGQSFVLVESAKQSSVRSFAPAAAAEATAGTAAEAASIFKRPKFGKSILLIFDVP